MGHSHQLFFLEGGLALRRNVYKMWLHPMMIDWVREGTWLELGQWDCISWELGSGPRRAPVGLRCVWNWGTGRYLGSGDSCFVGKEAKKNSLQIEKNRTEPTVLSRDKGWGKWARSPRFATSWLSWDAQCLQIRRHHCILEIKPLLFFSWPSSTFGTCKPES